MVAISIVGPKIPNLSQNFVNVSKKSSITRLFETFCIGTPYDKRKVMNGAYHVTLNEQGNINSSFS